MSSTLTAAIKLRFQYFTDILKLIFGKDGLSARHRRFAISGVSIIILSIVSLNTLFPIFLESLIQKETALKKGWFMRKMWRKFPAPYEFRVYLFNVTNPDEINKGKPPIVREVGPFVYDVWQLKTKIEDHEPDDTITYSTKNTFFFNSEKSKCLSDEDELVFGHFISLGLPMSVMKERPHLIPVANKAVDVVMGKPSSVFVKVKVKTILFDGFVLNCTGMDDFFGKALCNEIRESLVKYRGQKIADNVYSFSVWGYLNATDYYSGQTRIRRGIRNVYDIGELVEHNHMKYLSIWENDECDAIAGTDGSFFHPHLQKRKSLYVTNTFYCRSLTYRYESTVKYAGLKLFRYTTSLGSDLETNPKDKCFCMSPDRCFKNGVYELWKCFNNPYTASNPHFYLADPYYAKAVTGVKPNKEKHMIILDIDPLTGWPIRSHFRVQFNYALMKIPKYRLMKNFPEVMMPLTWVDQVIILPSVYLDKIVHFYQIISFARTTTSLTIFIGLVLCFVTVYHEYRMYKTRRAQQLVMKKYASRWKVLADKHHKRTMGISLRTIMTLKFKQRAQVAAAAESNQQNVS